MRVGDVRGPKGVARWPPFLESSGWPLAHTHSPHYRLGTGSGKECGQIENGADSDEELGSAAKIDPAEMGFLTRRTAMPEPSQKEIEARAYQLWEQAGRPEDREAEFWRLAEQELRNQDKSSPIRTPDTL